MKYKKVHLALLAFLGLNLFSSTAHAEWGVSIGMANQKSQYKGISNKPTIIPDITYRESGDKHGNKVASYDLILTSKNAGFSEKDSSVFKGMKGRKSSLDIGGEIIFNSPYIPLKFEASKDFRASKGFQASAVLGGLSPNNTGDLQIRPYAGVRYQSAKVIQYHYGVRSNEVTAKRKVYKGKSAITPFLGVAAVTNLSKNMQLYGDIAFEKRATSIANSPLVNSKKNDLKASINLVYWF